MSNSGYYSSTSTIQSDPSSFTAGSVVFQGNNGFLAQNNATFFWDNTNSRFGILTSTPAAPLDIVSTNTTTNTAQFGNFGIQSFAVDNALLNSNVYYNGGWIYRSTNTASSLDFSAGALTFQNFPSGTAGTAASPTTRFSVSAAGFVNAPQTLATPNLNIYNGANSVTVQASGSTTSHTLVLPPAQGSANTVLTNNGSGVLSWSASPIANTEVTSTASFTFPTTTDALITGMTITPAAGTYICWFDCDINSGSAGAAISVSIYVAGVQVAASLRKIIPFSGGTLTSGSGRGAVATHATVTVNGSQAIAVEGSTSNAGPTAAARTLTILRVA